MSRYRVAERKYLRALIASWALIVATFCLIAYCLLLGVTGDATRGFRLGWNMLPLFALLFIAVHKAAEAGEEMLRLERIEREDKARSQKLAFLREEARRRQNGKETN